MEINERFFKKKEMSFSVQKIENINRINKNIFGD